MRKHIFNAGPAVLPVDVLQQAAQGVTDLDGIGQSILEISHRSPEFTDIINETRSLIKEILKLDDEYEVLFLTGGASSQFFMIPFNFLGENDTAAYIETGTWAKKAIKEAPSPNQAVPSCPYVMAPTSAVLSAQNPGYGRLIRRLARNGAGVVRRFVFRAPRGAVGGFRTTRRPGRW